MPSMHTATNEEPPGGYYRLKDMLTGKYPREFTSSVNHLGCDGYKSYRGFTIYLMQVKKVITLNFHLFSVLQGVIEFLVKCFQHV